MKTYDLHKICKQFDVKPKYLTRLVSYMHSHGFINMVGNDRYEELEKLQYPMSKLNRDELFKLIDSVKRGYDDVWGDS